MAATITESQTASTLPQKKGDPPNLGTVKSGRALAFDGVVDYLDCGTGLAGTDLQNGAFSYWLNVDENNTNDHFNNFLAHSSIPLSNLNYLLCRPMCFTSSFGQHRMHEITKMLVHLLNAEFFSSFSFLRSGSTASANEVCWPCCASLHACVRAGHEPQHVHG